MLLVKFTTNQAHERDIMVIIPCFVSFVNRIGKSRKDLGIFSAGATGCDSLLGGIRL